MLLPHHQCCMHQNQCTCMYIHKCSVFFFLVCEYNIMTAIAIARAAVVELYLLTFVLVPLLFKEVNIDRCYYICL